MAAQPSRPRSEATRRRIVEATAAVVRSHGFMGTTTAAIAAQAGVTEGSIFYHFGSLPTLFAEVLRTSSDERLSAYADALAGVDDPRAVVREAMRLFAADQESGHVKVLAELIAGAGAVDELRPLVQEQVRRWVGFVEGVLDRLLAPSGLAPLLPSASDLAVVIVSLYTGAELLSALTPDIDPTGALAAVAQRAVPLLDAFTPTDAGGAA